MTCERCGTQRNVERSEELGVTLRGDCFAAGADATQIAIGVRARVHEVLDAMPEDGRPRDERLDEAVRIALGNARAERFWSERNGDEPEVEPAFAQPLADFIADKREAPEPLVGTSDDCIIPAFGLALLIAKGGKGKTTFCIELALHLASDIDYLGLEIPRALNVLFIENEGPREPFRRKLERKLANWSHEIEGAIYVHDQNWGHARLDTPEFVERLNDFSHRPRDRPGDR